MELESMAVEMPEVEGHPNRAPFRGVLTVVDVASQRAPLGSKGRRVVLTKSAAEAALPSLLGMALDYAPSFDRHDQRRKVGVITSAEIVERNLEVGGYLYAKDFPEVVEEVARAGRRDGPSGVRRQLSRNAFTTESTRGHRGKQSPKTSRSAGRDFGAKSAASAGHSRARLRGALMGAVGGIRELTRTARGGSGDVRIMEMMRAETGIPTSRKGSETWGTRSGLGMSFEVANVTVMDLRAPVWVLTKVTFTGAAILRRGKAAYEDTWIELA